MDSVTGTRHADLSELADKRGTIEGHLSSYAEIDELENLKAAIINESTAEKAQAATSLDLVTIRRFSEAISTRLSARRVPDSDRVRYDRNEQDLVTADQLRSAHGKGVRAILHSAFTIGLAQYCFDNDRPPATYTILARLIRSRRGHLLWHESSHETRNHRVCNGDVGVRRVGAGVG